MLIRAAACGTHTILSVEDWSPEGCGRKSRSACARDEGFIKEAAMKIIFIAAELECAYILLSASAEGVISEKPRGGSG